MRYRWLLILCLGLVLTSQLVQAQGEAGDLLGRINALRGSLGLPGYALNGALGAAAQSQAQWMADTGTVSHTRPDGSTPRTRAAAAGYTTTEVSENIYAGTNAGVDDAWTFWINSAIHYAGLTNGRYKEVGIGVAHTAWGAAYVLVFGNPGGPEYVPPQVNTNNSGGSGGGQPSYVAGLDAHGNIMHEVQPGDTPGDIALIYGYTWGDIPAMLALNGLTEANIRELKVGSIFLVPPQAGTYTPTAPAESPTPTATVWGEVTVISTNTPIPSATFTPEPPLTATFGIATLDSLPAGLALPTSQETPSPAATAQLIAALNTGEPTLMVKTVGVVTPGNRQSPWLLVALVVQVGVLLAAGFEFLRRRRR